MEENQRGRKCKFPGIACHFHFENREDLCWIGKDCPFEVYAPEGEEWNFQIALEKSPYWTLRGCDSKGQSVIDDTILRFIQNIAGDCTEPNSGIYKNPHAMFNALDLIYCILEETRNGPLKVQKLRHGTDELLTWHLRKTVKCPNVKEKGAPGISR